MPTPTLLPLLRPLLAAAATALACAGPLHAQTPAPGPAPAAAPMDMPRVIEHVSSLGYRELKEVERKGDKLYEIKARSPQGSWVELTVDARSGEILRSKPDH